MINSRVRWFLWLSWLLLTTCLSPLSAMVINGGSEATNNRFYSGAGKAFFGDPYDWSGVGKGGDSRRFAVMISPSYYLTATHYPPNDLSNTVVFHEDNTSSFPHTYNRAGGVAIIDPWNGQPTDLFLGRISSPVQPADNIASYPILLFIDYPTMTLDLGAYLDLPFFIYAANSSNDNSFGNYLGANSIDAMGYPIGNSTFMSYFIYDSPGILYEARMQAGDSGGPSFMAVDGILGLIGTHSGVASNPTASLDSFIPVYFQAIWNAMASDPNNVNGERPTPLIVFTNVPIIPEPATLALLATALPLLPRRSRCSALSVER